MIPSVSVTGSKGFLAALAELADIELLLVASPSYLDRVGRPRGIADLAALDHIRYKDDPEETSILMDDGREAPVRAAFAAQLPDQLRHAVQSHLGFAKVPRFFVSDLLERGEMEEILPERPLPKPLCLVRARGTQGASRRASIFAERFVAELARSPGFRVSPDLRVRDADLTASA